jgi:hypothetical protein
MNKKEVEEEEKEQEQIVEEQEEEIQSPILATRYAHKSAKLISGIEKNSYVVIAVIAVVCTLSVLDILRVIADNITDIIIVIFSGISIAALLFMLTILLKSKKLLHNWAELFEQNSIKAGMSICMANKSKEEAIRAIAETLQEVGDPLRKYISAKENFKEFIDVSIDKDVAFDVLIDSDRIQPITTVPTANSITLTNDDNSDLKSILREHGSIIIKIVDGMIDKGTVQSFLKLLSKYESKTKNKVGLTLVISDQATKDAYDLVKQSNYKNKKNRVVIIEKPTTTAS